MPPFDPDADRSSDLAWQIAQNGPIALFWSADVLAEAIAWFRQRDYVVREVEPRPSQGSFDILGPIAEALGFPDCFGANLAALDDCLEDLAENGITDAGGATSGTVVVVTGFDRLAAARPEFAHAVLDAFVRSGRHAALVGHRLLWLVQTDDPRLAPPHVGAEQVAWNPAEWTFQARGLAP